MSLMNHSIKELEEMLHNKEITAKDLVDASIDRIKEVDDKVKAFITVDEENAQKQAENLDKETETDYKLFGIPGAVKDNIVTKGMLTSCASQFMKNFIDPLYDATVVKKLKDEKSINMGKLNMDEFAMGSTTEHSSFHTTHNPWNTGYVPGGSSGGSAAAVAAGEVLYALGTDTGGSIRQPASFCGVVGMKPTYGRVSRFGAVGFGSSLDQVGPITRTVEDNARVLEVIAGQDKMDMTSAPLEVPSFTEGLTGDVKDLKIAVPKEYLSEAVDPEVKEAVMNALKVYESLGATWEEVSLPHSKYAAAAYYVISSGEASANLARFDGVRYGVRSEKAKDMIDMFKLSRGEGFGDEVKKRMFLGAFVLSAGNYEVYYKKAQQIRALVKQDFDNVLEKYDVIMGPTTPTPAFQLGEKDFDPMVVYARDLTTVPINLAGVPAISVPCGFSKKEGLPFGLQIIGKHFDEQTIYRVAHAFEQATDFHKKQPQLGGAE
ncbi:Asp-tRNA(Asn)/Glu-tRNA(Gln) amidotransferase subunit GatA [Cerasibacillus terrae]|uniref:Glutamyl-tRNA(Gln) amidotransferase subunit A n=1 Tax=Cerasibacillus terrae TaxID=2498845 RepID=A0A5C8NWR7_9BACI|nr:Asp-tRNA(Asn)/Glu-tRNA(Gln) amidotransferase subunit GatA [Cerasibacillus terrae]TXL65677.1 Asp-tRNA(Asn)/Glu-tRNA(Gln) amidotransferase subunit GatA [Cerasibacillus terrae]